MYRAVIAALLLASGASAHEMTPAYPDLKPSYVGGIHYSTLKIFNGRADVRYFEIKVFDADWQPVQFATEYRIMLVPYQAWQTFDVYIKDEDADRATYICSQSKIEADQDQKTFVASRICSRINGGRP